MKRSLTLCASMVLLAPLSLAMSLKDSEFSVNLGNRAVTIGDRTGTALNLLGDAKGTAAAGTSIALAHSTPTFIFGASALFPFGEKGAGIKLALEAQISNTDKHKLYDGVSSTAKVDIRSIPGTADAIANGVGGEFGVLSATGGKREATVEHQAAFGGKVLYAFGEDSNNIGIGVGILWTNDDYKYVVEEDPAPAYLSGVVTQAEVDAATPSFTNGFVDNIPQTTADGIVTADVIQGLYTPVLGTEEKYGDRMFWYGLATESSAKFSENVSVKAGLSYYRRQFEVSKSFTTSAPFVQTASDATMYIGSIGVSYNKAF